jgi:hypothetical protein
MRLLVQLHFLILKWSEVSAHSLVFVRHVAEEMMYFKFLQNDEIFHPEAVKSAA